MKFTVQSSRGGEYIVDTDSVTCTCPDFRFRCCHKQITSEARQCKHIRQIFSEHPELIPSEVASAMRRLDKKLEVLTNDNSITFLRILLESYSSVLKDYLTMNIYVVGDFAKNLHDCKSLDYIVKKSEFDKAQIDNIIELIGEEQEISDNKLTLLGDGYIPINFFIVDDEIFVYKYFFLSNTEDEIERVVNRANVLGYTLTPDGFSSEKEIPTIKTLKDLYNFLNITFTNATV